MSSPARLLPPLHALLERRAIRSQLRRWRRPVVLAVLREQLERERERLLAGERPGARRDELLRQVERAAVAELDALGRPSLQTVLNATGVLLHTNLGRARLSGEAAAELQRVATRPVALEIDLATRERGRRHARVERWLQLLVGCEAALVLNNGAAALWHAVNGLAARRRAIVSRGEMVAVGGSFRMGDVLSSTRARVVEVGTTNRTTLDDYDRELREGDLVVKVHPSNYRVEGYTAGVELAGLAALCTDRGARLHFDAGSGSLYDFGGFGLSGEPPVDELLAQGPTTLSFSGDKLLGGPQAGLLVGRAAEIGRLARHPMMRAFRCDKLTLAALESTLAAYGAAGKAPALPLFEALALGRGRLRERGRALRDRLRPHLPHGWTLGVGRCRSTPGGGSYAMETMDSIELELRGPDEASLARLHRALRTGDPAVLARVQQGAVRLDLRSVAEDELEALGEALEGALAGLSGPGGD